MSDMPKPRYEDERAARAFERKLEPDAFAGGNEVHPPSRPDPMPVRAHDTAALEAEPWYQDWLKRRGNV